MKLYYYCSSCKKENGFSTKATNRFELQEERGNNINERRSYCGTLVKRRINRAHAKPAIFIPLIGIVLGGIATYFLWNLGWVSTVTFLIPTLFFGHATSRASSFNKVMVDDKN